MALVKGLGANTPVLEGRKVMLKILGCNGLRSKVQKHLEVNSSERGLQPTSVHFTDCFLLAECSKKGTWRMGAG